MTRTFNFQFGKFLYDGGRVFINDKEIERVIGVEFSAHKDKQFPIIKLEYFLLKDMENAQKILE